MNTFLLVVNRARVFRSIPIICSICISIAYIFSPTAAHAQVYDQAFFKNAIGTRYFPCGDSSLNLDTELSSYASTDTTKLKTNTMCLPIIYTAGQTVKPLAPGKDATLDKYLDRYGAGVTLTADDIKTIGVVAGPATGECKYNQDQVVKDVCYTLTTTSIIATDMRDMLKGIVPTQTVRATPTVPPIGSTDPIDGTIGIAIKCLSPKQGIMSPFCKQTAQPGKQPLKNEWCDTSYGSCSPGFMCCTATDPATPPPEECGKGSNSAIVKFMCEVKRILSGNDQTIGIDENGCIPGSYSIDLGTNEQTCIDSEGNLIRNPGPVPFDPNITGAPGSGDVTEGLIPDQNPITASCQPKVDAAIQKVVSNPTLIKTYKDAVLGTSIPWEVIAAIHYIEANNNPNGSCISGRPIGSPEPDQGDKTYSSLLATCQDAARIFTVKKATVNMLVKANGMSEPTAFQMLAGQFMAYNAFTQGECAMVKTSSAICSSVSPSSCSYTTKYAGGTWPGIPNRGQCGNGPGDRGEKFVGDRHVYPMACYDSEHEDMWFHFHYGETVQKHNRIGALTFIKGLQAKMRTLPPTEIDPSYPGYTPITNEGLTYYPQCNGSKYTGPWANKQMYSRSGASVGCTFCKASCGLTSGAMIVSSYTNASVNPEVFLQKYNTFRNMTCDGAYISDVVNTIKSYGVVTGPTISINEDINGDLFAQKAIPSLRAGNTLLSLATINGIGHYVWIVGTAGNGDVLIYDPYWGKDTPVPFKSSSYRSAIIRYVVPVRKP